MVTDRPATGAGASIDWGYGGTVPPECSFATSSVPLPGALSPAVSRLPPSGSHDDPGNVAQMNDARVEDDLSEAYDVVEDLWETGQPPSPDWRKIRTLASRLAELAARIDARSGSRD